MGQLPSRKSLVQGYAMFDYSLSFIMDSWYNYKCGKMNEPHPQTIEQDQHAAVLGHDLETKDHKLIQPGVHELLITCSKLLSISSLLFH